MAERRRGLESGAPHIGPSAADSHRTLLHAAWILCVCFCFFVLGGGGGNSEVWAASDQRPAQTLLSPKSDWNPRP